MEVEACYSYGFLPADADRGSSRQQPPPPPPPYGYGYGYGYGHRHRHGPPPPPHPAPPEDGELWEYFPCPFCYIEVEVPFICSHLQEEHCFDTRNAVCPICANNLGRDMAAHFRLDHSHLLKRRKPSKPCAWPPEAAAASASGKGTAATYKEQDPAPDPLLSHFICSSSSVEVEQTHHDALEDGERCTRNALGLQERLQRIDFLTEILMSTIL